jgi:hypothetical protein
VVWALVALSALAGAASAAEPAGWLPADLLWRAGFAALVTAATARAARWSWIVLAATAAAASTVDGPTLFGFAALAVALVAAVRRRRSRVLGALAGGFAVQALLRLELPDTGMSALLTVVAVAPVLVSAYSRLRRDDRRVVHVVLFVAGVVVLVAVAGLAVAVLRSEQQVREAADAVRDGLDAVRENEPDRAVALLTEAQAGFEEAHGSVATWGLAARVVPVLGHQARALEVVTGQGAALAEAAARSTVEADTDELRFEDGVLDLELVAGFEQPLRDARDVLAEAEAGVDEARTMWLVDPLSTGVADFADEVGRALPEAELAIEAVELAPALFGGEGERHYFIAFTQPAESRGLGGFIGNYGELTARDGDVELTRSGRIRELIAAPGAAQRTITGPRDYLRRYGRFQPAQFLQDLTFSPDGPSVGDVTEQLYPQAGGQEVDGVIIVDPVALAALMEFTGPIPVEGLDEPLTADNAADILIREQYLRFAEDEQQRVDLLDEATEETFERLTEGDLPSPRVVADVLGPVVEEGRLIVHLVDGAEQDLVERVGLDGALPPVEGDFVSLTTQNGGNNKIDVFLERALDYQARWDPATGEVRAEATVELRNTAPASGLPGIVIGSSDARALPPGTNLLWLSFYSALPLAGAELDGVPVAMEPQIERGRWVYSRYFQLPPGGEATLRLELTGVLRPGADYRLTYAPQPTVNPDRVTLAAALVDGWVTTESAGWERTATGAQIGFAAGADERFALDATRN